MTISTKSTEKSFLEKPLSQAVTINWELVFYITIFVLAVISRFYILGNRVMSHDESLHALFSFKLYNGEGYIHDPLMHGPLQFHLVALSYLLFGVNDFAARIPAAAFGVAMVMLPIAFRQWMGKTGAAVTSFGLLISPLVLFYARYIRNESYDVFFTAVMALALFQFMRTRQQRWLYVEAITIALFISAKEIAYIHGFIGVVFVLGALLWENLSAKRSRQVFYGLLGITVAGFVAAIYLNGQPAPESGIAWHKVGSLLLMLFGVLAGVLTIAANTDRVHKPVTSALQTFGNSRTAMLLIGPLVAAAVIFFLLHTTFFTNPKGFISGTYGAVSYWLKQQGVQRGSQPGYYYLVVTPMYEFLPLLVGIIGGIWLMLKKFVAFGDADVPETPPAKGKKHAVPTAPFHSDGGTFAAYLIFWAISAFVIYSWAGEKMPWLAVHIALPFIFLMGYVSEMILRKFNWRLFTTGYGVLFFVLTLVLGGVLLVALTSKPFRGQSSDDLAQTMRFISAVVFAALTAVGLWRIREKLAGHVKPMLYLVGFSALAVLTIRFAIMSSYINYDYVNEFLVYAHAAPDVKWVINEIDDISRRTVGDKQIKVAYGGVIWPLEWYMRDYPNRAFFGANPSRDAINDAPVVIISPDDQVKLEDVTPYLGNNYERFDYRQVWWPLENYRNQSLSRIWNDFVSPKLPATPAQGQSQEEADRLAIEAVPKNRKWLWDILFYRKVDDHTFKDWPFRTQMYMFVRKDIAAKLWNYQTGTAAAVAPEVDVYADARRQLSAVQLWGSLGAGEGQFANPRAMALSPQGQLYIADSGNHRIQVFDQNGTFLKAWPVPAGNGAGQVGDEMWGIAVSADGNVYISDTWNHRVEIFDEDGNYLSEFGTFADTQGDPLANPGAFWGPRDIVIDAEGNVYVTDTGNKRIEKFAADGTFRGAWGGGGITPGHFEEPTGLAIDADGNIYVADTWNQRVQVLDSTMQPVTEWKVVGWDTQNVLNKPFIAVDAQKRVYISDPENYRVIVYDNSGKILFTFGQYGQDVQSFQLPLDVAVADDGSLFVLDSGNNRVMKFDAANLQ